MASLLQRHVAALTSGDADATAALYADDAQLVSFDGVAEGRAAIADRYRLFYDYHGTISGVEILHEQAAGDDRFVLFAVESERGRFELVNVYLTSGDAIARHFSNETTAHMARHEVVDDAGSGESGDGESAGGSGHGAAPTAGAGANRPDDTTAER